MFAIAFLGFLAALVAIKFALLTAGARSGRFDGLPRPSQID